MSCADLFLALIAILFPPVAVWIKSGLCTADSLINLALCCLGYLPGLIHAWYIIAKYPEYEYDGYEPVQGDPERGGTGNERVTYYYVSHAPGGQHGQGPAGAQGQGQQGGGGGMRDYGATQTQTQTQQVPQGGSGSGETGSSEAQGQEGGARPPPTYAEAVRGDHKVQTQD